MSLPENPHPSPDGADYHPQHNIGRALIDAAAIMTAAVDRRARSFGISGAQWIVLIRIGGGLAATASDLCRSLGKDSGAMTRMLDRLERQGLVRRLPSPEDGRAARLELTPAGEALYPAIRPIASEVIAGHLRGFSAEESAQFLEFLERVIANGASPPPEP
ncbi:MarR family transcriptional regulator [Rhizobiaceae bacterium BDR2-2]|uniref:MarR family transcriptional regulator n=1 Tax=Ectorhizobium quercum TaxID=2965071 RepID=A0AAE3SUR2_9HYPH|nr:MarR family transcriptional regulator [Ectorhizobium quercum]MCX8995545.1 MarR family transcriptional regulator [Ectorhizobium quercum]